MVGNAEKQAIEAYLSAMNDALMANDLVQAREWASGALEYAAGLPVDERDPLGVELVAALEVVAATILGTDEDSFWA